MTKNINTYNQLPHTIEDSVKAYSKDFFLVALIGHLVSVTQLLYSLGQVCSSELGRACANWPLAQRTKETHA